MSTATAPVSTSLWNTQASNGEGGDFESPPPGSHPAYCIGLIDLGTHDFAYKGENKASHKILILWELTAEHMRNGETFVVHRDFTWSLKTSKAHLRQFLEGWQGRAFADGEDFDLLSLVKQPCVVNLSEGFTGNGKKFIEVASCGKPMRGLTVPPMTIPPILFNLTECTSCKTEPAIPDFIPPLYGRKILDEIKSSKEWIALPPF